MLDGIADLLSGNGQISETINKDEFSVVHTQPALRAAPRAER